MVTRDAFDAPSTDERAGLVGEPLPKRKGSMLAKPAHERFDDADRIFELRRPRPLGLRHGKDAREVMRERAP